MMTYITQTGQKKLKNFVYKGGSDSLAYQYIWSPFAEFLLKFTPSNAAPNLITMISLIILTLSHAAFVLGVQYQHKIQSWRVALMGISILVYQNLDNLDGKQARKTKSSSPLGMLFDHGTDALCSFLICSQVLELLEVQSGKLKILILFMFIMLVSFAAMWSQYCMGFFRLGRINPIDEGLPSYALFAFISIYIPFNFWGTQSEFGKFNQIILFALAILVIVVIYFMVYQNYKNTGRQISDINFSLILPAKYMSVLLILNFSESSTFDQAYWPLMYALMFFWSQNMIQIQLCAITQEKYSPFHFSNFAFVLLFLGYLVLDIDAKVYFTRVALVSSLLFLEYVVSVSTHIARILGIKIFSIKNTGSKSQ